MSKSHYNIMRSSWDILMVMVMLMYVEKPDLRDLLELMEGGGEEFVILFKCPQNNWEGGREVRGVE